MLLTNKSHIKPKIDLLFLNIENEFLLMTVQTSTSLQN